MSEKFATFYNFLLLSLSYSFYSSLSQSLALSLSVSLYPYKFSIFPACFGTALLVFAFFSASFLALPHPIETCVHSWPAKIHPKEIVRVTIVVAQYITASNALIVSFVVIRFNKTKTETERFIRNLFMAMHWCVVGVIVG